METIIEKSNKEYRYKTQPSQLHLEKQQIDDIVSAFGTIDFDKKYNYKKERNR